MSVFRLKDRRFGLWVLWKSRSDFQGPVGGASVCAVHRAGSIHSPRRSASESCRVRFPDGGGFVLDGADVAES